jgi:Amidohydrolase family
MRLLILLLLVSQTIFAQKNYEFRNGNWYNGADFTTGTWYTTNGKFTKKAPSKIDSVIDLTNMWVVPPMGDAFSSSLANHPTPESQLKTYMNDGVFYIQVLGNTKADRAKVEPMANKNTAPDVSFANGEITCTLGEPFLRYEPAAMGLKPMAVQSKMTEVKLSRAGMGDGYWFIDNKDALSANWDKIKALKPGVITIWLLDAEKSGGKEGKGLTPDMAKAIVKKAHKADLKVYAHVENISDVRLAVKLGIDGLANLPGSTWNGQGSTTSFELTNEDLKLLAKKQTVIVPLFAQAQLLGPASAKTQEFQRNTLKRMFDAGVNVCVGSDDPQRTIRSEVNYWFGLGEIDYKAMLKSLCERTPQAIFPERKVGKIESGYEASFLVLDDNPINNILKLRATKLKVKNGALLK